MKINDADVIRVNKGIRVGVMKITNRDSEVYFRFIVIGNSGAIIARGPLRDQSSQADRDMHHFIRLAGDGK